MFVGLSQAGLWDNNASPGPCLLETVLWRASFQLASVLPQLDDGPSEYPSVLQLKPHCEMCRRMEAPSRGLFVSAVLWIKPKASHLLNQYSPTEPHPQIRLSHLEVGPLGEVIWRRSWRDFILVV